MANSSFLAKEEVVSSIADMRDASVNVSLKISYILDNIDSQTLFSSDSDIRELLGLLKDNADRIGYLYKQLEKSFEFSM